MKKNLLWLCMFGLCLLIFCCPMALALANDRIEIPCDSTFELKSSCQMDNGQILLAGYITKDGVWQPIVYGLDSKFSVEWTYSPETNNLPKGLYYSIVPMDKSTALGLRYHSSDSINISIIEKIQDGQGVVYAIINEQISQICSAEDGFVFSYQPTGESSVIAKLNAQKEREWEVKIDKDIRFTKIMNLENGYVCMGNYRANKDAQPLGVLIKLSQIGEVVWSYQYDKPAQFSDAIETIGGDIVVVGDTKPANEPENSIIASYNKDGLVWQTDRKYANYISGYTFTALEADEKYFAACREAKQRGEIWLMAYDMQGNALSEWTMPTGSVYLAQNFYFYHNVSGIYLLVNGDDEYGDGFKTVINKISYP